VRENLRTGGEERAQGSGLTGVQHH
jgi:hypothetical protein